MRLWKTRSTTTGRGIISVGMAFALLLALPGVAQAESPEWVQLGDTFIGDAERDSAGGWVTMSADGTTMAVGAPGNDDGGEGAGQVKVYRLDGSNWNQLGGDINGEPNTFAATVAMSDDATTMIIGAEYSDAAGENAGQAVVYRYDGGDWNQLGPAINGEHPADRSASRVAIDATGDTVAIASSSNDDAGWNAGHVRIFRYDADTWQQLGSDIDGERRRDRSGSDVALSNDGNTVAIGSIENDDAANNAGHVRIFRYDADTWQQLGSDIDGQQGDLLGNAIAISGNGDTIVTGGFLRGVPLTPDRAFSSGVARVFNFDGVAWHQVGGDILGQSAFAIAGWSVAISTNGDTVAVGAPRHRTDEAQTGQVRVFRTDGDEWNQVGSEVIGEDRSSTGSHVALSGDGTRLVVGASSYANSTGKVRVFSLLDDPGPPVDPTTPLQGDAVVFVTNVATGRYLDGDGVHRAWNVDTSPDGRYDARWKLADNGDGTWSLLNQRRIRYLDGDGVSENWNVGLSTQLNEDDRWEITPADDGTTFTLRNAVSGRYLNQAENNNVDTVATAAIGDATSWEITPVG